MMNKFLVIGQTTTQLLYMKGEMRCNFEGRVDICFNQSEDDDFDWLIGVSIHPK
jgi:hypothetical protein